jgi:hypothetical protein
VVLLLGARSQALALRPHAVSPLCEGLWERLGVVASCIAVHAVLPPLDHVLLVLLLEHLSARRDRLHGDHLDLLQARHNTQYHLLFVLTKLKLVMTSAAGLGDA